MKTLFTLLFIVGFCVITSAQIPLEDYYRYRRQELFQKQLEKYHLPTKDENGKEWDYADSKTNLKLFNLLADEWEKQRTYKLPHKENPNPRTTIQEQNLYKFDSLMMSYIRIYELAGLDPYEAEILPTRRIYGYRNSENPNEEYGYLDDAQSDVTILAYREYDEKSSTSDFGELMYLIKLFRLAGYSANEAYHRIQYRFSGHKHKETLNALAPFYTLSFWNIGNRYDDFSSPQPNEVFGYHQNYALKQTLKKGFLNMPKELIAEIENAQKPFKNNPLKYVAIDAVNTKDYNGAKDIFLNNLMYSTKSYHYHIDQGDFFTLKNVIISGYPYIGEAEISKRLNEIVNLITWEEFETLRKKFNISNEQTLYLFPNVFTGDSRTFTDKNGKSHTVKIPEKFEP